MTLEEEYRLSCYEELTTLGNHNHIYLIKHKLSGEIFVKKVLSRFSLNVYKQLRDLQISGIPKIHDLILENDSLILIEDYIHGQTLEQLLEEQTTLVYSDALAIMRRLCDILKSLHALTPPIIHRDLKLSNIILTFALTTRKHGIFSGSGFLCRAFPTARDIFGFPAMAATCP